MQELWQLYSDDQKPIQGKGASKDDVFTNSLLHGAAHVWIWRYADNGIEVMLQRRAATKRTWPNLLDISAAGHIDLGESPLEAAIRETKEELGLKVQPKQLEFVGVRHIHIAFDEKSIENEFRWIYLLQLTSDEELTLQASEVSSVTWLPLEEFASALLSQKDQYVPQGDDYFDLVVNALKSHSNPPAAGQ